MLIEEVKSLLGAKVMCCETELTSDVKTCCGSDLMSDVLAFESGHGGALVTGLINPQVIRTAEMLDIKCIIFARGKVPSEEMIAMAVEREIVLMATRHSMFGACGILYGAGLKEGGAES